jgi:solute carrier family 25 (mitochondrial uncoupling protein), member 8/9
MGRGDDAEARSGTPAGPSGVPPVPRSGVWRQVALPVLVSGASVSCATACTNPLDVLKVRLQVLDPTRSGTPPPRGMGDALGRLLRNEGPLALWKGLTPSLARAMCYGGLRLGLYQPILGAVESARGGATKSSAPSRVGRPGGAWEATARSKRKEDAFEPDREQTDDENRFRFANDGSVASKVSAGAASGAFAAFLLNPTELVKTRLMARDDHTKNKSVTAWSCASTIVRERGVSGLWRGAAMSTTRSAALTASQCAAYDSAKSFVRKRRRGEEDDLLTHLCASMLTGLVTTTVTNPVDMIKTQLYMSAATNGESAATRNESAGAAARRKREVKNSAQPAGAVAAARDVLKREGPRGFMRGWSANYLRLGPQTVITFVALEQFRRLAGMDAL